MGQHDTTANLAGSQQFLTFSLSGEMFGVGILTVKEIIEYGSVTEIPMVPAFICGVINLRGAVVPVIDLHRASFALFEGSGVPVCCYPL